VAVRLTVVLVQNTDLLAPQKAALRSLGHKQRKQTLNLAKTRTANAMDNEVQTTVKVANAKAVNAVGALNKNHPSWKKHGRV
tara:strand:- start:480 stop:725 length:246 start_codon:yes stop_codon:yes gene_type:complete